MTSSEFAAGLRRARLEEQRDALHEVVARVSGRLDQAAITVDMLAAVKDSASDRLRRVDAELAELDAAPGEVDDDVRQAAAAARARHGERKAAVVRALVRFPSGLTHRSIRERTGVPSGVLSTVLHRLRLEDQALFTGGRWYWIGEVA